LLASTNSHWKRGFRPAPRAAVYETNLFQAKNFTWTVLKLRNEGNT